MKKTMLMVMLLISVVVFAELKNKGSVAKMDNTCRISYKDEDLKKLLSPEQYRIVRENGTELPFKNEYYNNKKPGIYVDIVSGEVLFSSTEKYDSGTGWPSFYSTIVKKKIKEISDKTLGMVRTEVRSNDANSHLGHLFNDGPAPTGLRYCINSGALKFIPAEELEEKGYKDYTYLFPEIYAKKKNLDFIVLGAGCFWGTEAYFKAIKGVKEIFVGYAGGKTPYPDYEEVSSGKTGHAESALIFFAPNEVSLDTILRHFFRIHEPDSLNRQGNDIGTQYRSMILYHSDIQKKEIDERIKRLLSIGKYKKIVTEVKKFEVFYKAEEYHQDYLDKNPGGYCHIDMRLLKTPLDKE